MKTPREHSFCVLSERLLLFSVASFAYDLAFLSLDFLYEWGLLRDGKIQGNIRCLNNFLSEVVTEYKKGVEEYAESMHMKLYYFGFDVEFGDLSEYIEDSEQFSKKLQRYCKKYLCDGKIIPILSEKYSFKSIEFEGVRCLKLNGEQIEEIIKKLNKKP
jgi:hypothetical protein